MDAAILTPPLQIRPAYASESHMLTELACASKAHWNYSAEQIKLWRAELTVHADQFSAGNVYVGVIDNVIVAMMALQPAKMTWKLDHFFVDPNHLRQGIGKTMFDYAIQTAAQRGARAVSIDSDPHAEKFYLECGAVRSFAKAAPIEGDNDRIRPQMLYLIVTKKV
jgi:GNAT superfamily N-acetyltransferase